MKGIGTFLIVIGFILLPLSCFGEGGGAKMGVASLVILIVGFVLFLGGRKEPQQK